jgi:type I restriction enzyme S subunit
MLGKRILRNTGWEKFRIKNISKLGRGRVISTTEINGQLNPKYPVYSSQTSNNGIMGYLDDYDFDGEYITWTTDGANAGTVFYRNGKFNCTNVCGTIKISNSYNPYFVAQSLQFATKKYVSANLANPKLMNNIMADIEVYLPSIATQNTIANLFKYIDVKLEVEEKVLNAQIKIKKHLLLNLFV